MSGASFSRQQITELLDGLEKAYPNARVELEFSTPFELLVATILAAQCTDARVNQVTGSIFKKYTSPEDFVRAPVQVLEEDIRPTGFYRNKAKSLKACCEKLLTDFGGNLPDNVEELASLPGVGRKTANIVLGNAMGRQTIAVDTHVKRVSNRLGLSQSNNPDQIEKDLRALFPGTKWTRVSNLLVFHGRYTCKARNPDCAHCPVYALCRWSEKP